MPRVHPTWIIREFLRVDTGVVDRLSADVAVPVEGAAVAVWYLGIGEIRMVSSMVPGHGLPGTRLSFLHRSRLASSSPDLSVDSRPHGDLLVLRGVDHVIVELSVAPGRSVPAPCPYGSVQLAARTGRVQRLHTLILEATTGCQTVASRARTGAGGGIFTPGVAGALAEEAASLGARSGPDLRRALCDPTGRPCSRPCMESACR